ncbi:methyltransferase domain-containing protein [Sulfurimonas sp.]|uniref:methyltransferase domain-containing protein n=1 Tax=Sulfurimonas sp. TaxID=2022749 RepID=UPI00356B57DE
MKISQEFSKYAKTYNTYNVIQNKVIKHLLSKISKKKNKPQNILDIGCGSGSLCKKIDWKYKHFTGVDFSPGMLELHPRSKEVECIYGDFNDQTLFDNLLTYNYDFIFSASALQWADDIDCVFANIKSLDAPIALAIFTSGTFKTLNKTANLEPILKSADYIDKLQKKYFNLEMEVIEYRLEFENNREMFRYIKKSGVSGSRNVLDYKQTKELIKNYPLNYLEFEVVYIISK